MGRPSFDSLNAFAAVARERSFARAAAALGVAPSAMSHAVRTLEDSVGLRLLNRTTRSVAPTEAGERLLRTLGPALDDIERGLASLNTLREMPSGTVRLTTVKHGYMSIIRPVLPTFLEDYPDVRIEVVIDDELSDIVADRFDAGLRFGGLVAKDMVALRVGPDVAAAVVAAPAYFRRHPAPKTPHDLGAHRCINYRLASTDRLYRWRFEKDGQRLEVRVEGALVFNDGDPILAAALDGGGLAYLFLDQVQHHLDAGRLVRVLADWCPPFAGYHLYRPSARHSAPALKAFIDALSAQHKRLRTSGRT